MLPPLGTFFEKLKNLFSLNLLEECQVGFSDEVNLFKIAQKFYELFFVVAVTRTTSHGVTGVTPRS